MQRHICEACLLIVLSIAGMYLWGFISGKPHYSAPFTVDPISAVIATIAALTSLIFLLWNPPKATFITSITVYYLTLATTASLTIQSGGFSSPFIVLWFIVSIFAGVFSIWSSLVVTITVAAYSALLIIDSGMPLTGTIIQMSLASILPILLSLTVWHQSKVEVVQPPEEKTYHTIKSKLNEATARADIIIDAIGDGVVVIDSTGVIKLINPAAQNIVGWSDKDAISLNYKSVIKLINQNEKSIDNSSDPIGQVLNLNQQVRTNDLGIETKSGKKILISLVVSPIGGPGSGVIAVFRDITKEKTEEHQQAEFISTASHEMRTPVASIEGYVGLAMNPQTAQIDVRAREYLNKAHQSAQHLGHLFQDLLDISKADDGRILNNPKVVNIVKFTHDIVQDFKARAAEKGLRLIYKPIPDDDNEKHVAPDYSVNLDNDHIHEILDNLIDNAIKYTPKGDIIVDIVGSEDHVVISVKDSGIGISAEDMPHLFQKFYRIDNKDTREIGGTGLGLYLCRRLTEIMGGRIWAESTIGVGTTFFVELPRVSNDQAKLLKEQSTLVAQEKSISGLPATATSQTPAQKQVMDIIRPVNSVPRGQALTPEQIAEYVAKQHALAQQQEPTPSPAPVITAPTPVANPVPTPITNRPHSLNIPTRPSRS